MFSVEGKTTTASVKFEAKIKGLDEKGEVVPVEKLSVYLPARFAGSVRAVAEQTDIVYMQFGGKAGVPAFPKAGNSNPGKLRGRADQSEKSENGCI